MEQQHEPLFDLYVDHDSGASLAETTKWSRFVSVIIILGAAICLVLLGFGGTALLSVFEKLLPNAEIFAAALVFIVILIVAIFAIIAFYLFRFSTLTRNGIRMQDQQMFNSGLHALKIYFILTGIFGLLSLLTNLYNLVK